MNLIQPILNLNLLQTLLLFYIFFFLAMRQVGISAPQPGIEPALPALEGEVLTTGLPGKSPSILEALSPLHWVLQLIIFLFFI